MKGRLLLILFALPFAGIGGWMTWSLARTALDARAMQAWVPVSAEVMDGGYRTHSDDDSTTYEAWAEYRYAFAGQSFTGQRVQVAGGADNIGAFQEELGRRLAAAARGGTPLTVYVNPAAPGQSVVDRHFRWGLAGFKLIFVLVFGGIGIALLVHAIRGAHGPATTGKEAERAPWLANPDWQSARVLSNSRAVMWGTWAFAALWNLVSAPLPFVLAEEVLEKGNTVAITGLVFPLVGLVLLGWALRRTFEWRRFGATPVVLDPFPGSIGGHVGGTIDTRLPYDPARRFRLVLSNIYSYETGSGDNRSRHERIDWEDELLAHTESVPGGGTRLVFRFDVPEALAESVARPAGDAWQLWRLSVKSDLPGADLDRAFDIPVYRTGRRSQGITASRAGAPAGVQAAFYEDAVRGRLRQTRDGMKTTLTYPMGHQAGGNLVGVGIGALFAAGGWFLAVKEGHPLFGGVFGGTGALVLLLAAYMLCKSLTVSVDGDTIASTRRWLGLPLGTRTLRRSRFERFDLRSNVSTRSGNDTTRYYKVCGIDRDGNAVVLGENFAGDGEARAAIRFLARELGVRESEPRGGLRLDRDLLAKGTATTA